MDLKIKPRQSGDKRASSKYNKAFGLAIDRAGLRDISESTRKAALDCFDHLSEITAFREKAKVENFVNFIPANWIGDVNLFHFENGRPINVDSVLAMVPSEPAIPTNPVSHTPTLRPAPAGESIITAHTLAITVAAPEGKRLWCLMTGARPASGCKGGICRRMIWRRRRCTPAACSSLARHGPIFCAKPAGQSNGPPRCSRLARRLVYLS
jgi:hypothetical protein